MGTASKIGIVGGAVITFAGFLMVSDAAARSGKLDGVCVSSPTGPSACPSSSSQAISNLNTELLVGGVGTLVGIGMIVFGFLARPDYTPPPQTSSSFTLEPSPGGLRGTF